MIDSICSFRTSSSFITFIVNKSIIFLLLFQFFYINIYAQTNEKNQPEKVKRVIASIDLETILSPSIYLNILYEKELGKRISLLYGFELQNPYSAVKINGKIHKLSTPNYYYLKAKSHYYILPFNKEKHSSLNGLYLGPSLKAGTAKGKKYKYLVLSPGIFLGSSFVISKKIILNIEFDFDGYLDWRNEIDTSEGYSYQGLTNIYMNLWFSVGYRF